MTMKNLIEKKTPPGADGDLFYSVVKISLLFLGGMILLNFILVAILTIVK